MQTSRRSFLKFMGAGPALMLMKPSVEVAHAAPAVVPPVPVPAREFVVERHQPCMVYQSIPYADCTANEDGTYDFRITVSKPEGTYCG